MTQVFRLKFINNFVVLLRTHLRLKKKKVLLTLQSQLRLMLNTEHRTCGLLQTINCKPALRGDQYNMQMTLFKLIKCAVPLRSSCMTFLQICRTRFSFFVGGVCYMICFCLCSAFCSQQHWWPFCVSAVAGRRVGQRVHSKVLFTLTAGLLTKTGEGCK